MAYKDRVTEKALYETAIANSSANQVRRIAAENTLDEARALIVQLREALTRCVPIAGWRPSYLEALTAADAWLKANK